MFLYIDVDDRESSEMNTRFFFLIALNTNTYYNEGFIVLNVRVVRLKCEKREIMQYAREIFKFEKVYWSNKIEFY